MFLTRALACALIRGGGRTLSAASPSHGSHQPQADTRPQLLHEPLPEVGQERLQVGFIGELAVPQTEVHLHHQLAVGEELAQGADGGGEGLSGFRGQGLGRPFGRVDQPARSAASEAARSA